MSSGSARQARRAARPLPACPLPARLLAACLLAACLLAACTTGGGGHHAPGSRGLSRRFRPFPHPLIFAGGGGVVQIIGSGSGGGQRPRITLPPIPPAGSSLSIQMPLEAYQAVSTQQQEALAQASNLLTQRCMAERGFDDSSVASEPFTSVASLQQLETAGAGLTSMTQARTFGFAKPKGAGAQGQSGPAILGFVGQSAFSTSLKTGRAYTEALYGFTPGGGGGPGHPSCLQLASQLVYGPRVGEPVSDPVPQIAGQAVSFTQTDPRIRVLNQAWSACMARRHYQYGTPAQVEGHHWKTPPNKAEIATAAADVQCKTRTNYLNTWLATEAAYQQALIGRNLAALSQLSASFTPLLRHAEAALAAPALPGA